MNPAYEHNGAACTRAAFYAVACDPRRSVAVEACAGAGKTWMLVSRILRALLDGAEPQQILAITFTKKAAGEMRQRLQQWLADFAQARPADPASGRAAETPAAWQQRLLDELVARGIEPGAARDLRQPLQDLYQRLLDHGRPVQIRTFHSWFAALLRSAPLQVLQDLGLPSAYELLEDDQEAVAEVWRRYLRRVAQDGGLSADYAGLVRELGRYRAHLALEGALAKRVEFGLADAASDLDEAVTPFGAVYPRLAGVAEPADTLMTEDARSRWQARARALGAEKNKTPRTAAAAVIDAFAQDDSATRLALLRQTFFVKQEDRLTRHLQGFDVAVDAEAELQQLLVAQRQHDARHYHQRLVRLTRPLIDEFAALKRERSWVDMTDIERAALVLLSDPVLSGWVQERLDARVRHLLIDEFQDTNPLQWQALKAWLESYAGAGGGQGVPSVFIVGDPKQSIYRFRRADPRVFAAAQDFIVQALGGERLACDHTHRNAPVVLGVVNAVMAAAQADGQFSGFRAHSTESKAPGQVAALPLIPRPERAPAAADGGAWRDSLSTPRVLLEDSLRTLECRQAARWIAAQVQAGAAPKDIMVLARKREPLGELQSELRLLGIPCEQPEQQLLGELPAVQDLLALVDALVSPGNDLMLARALKSPLFGLGDDDLTRIALAVRADAHSPFRGADRGAEPGDATPPPAPSPSWLDTLPRVELGVQDGQALHAKLMQCRHWLITLPPHDALQAIYSHHDVLARFAAAAPPPERAHTVAQLRAVLAAALQVQGGRYLTAYQWVRALRRQRLAAPRHAVPEAVQLLTVHGAKGLQAAHVLLLDAASAAPRGGGPSALIDWPGEAPAPLRFAFLAGENTPPPDLVELAQQEAEARAREELNALYVAMTRASQRLVLSGITPHAPPASSWWQRIEPLAEALPAPDISAPESAESAVGAEVDTSLLMLELPPAPARPADVVQATDDPLEADPTDASRLGEAMHWLLEHVADTPQGWHAERLAQAMRRFNVRAEQAARAEQLARRILGGEAAWAWQAGEVIEAFDEVELSHQGQRLRIDRLVRRRASGAEPESWWVLDYKSAARPEADPLLVAQLERYRDAVRQIHPGRAVKAAFLSADGRLVQVA